MHKVVVVTLGLVIAILVCRAARLHEVQRPLVPRTKTDTVGNQVQIISISAFFLEELPHLILRVPQIDEPSHKLLSQLQEILIKLHAFDLVIICHSCLRLFSFLVIKVQRFDPLALEKVNDLQG